MNTAYPHRGIKSWVKRHPRLSQAQKNLLENHKHVYHFLPEDIASFLNKVESLSPLYENRLLDIGFGLGHSVLHHAKKHPDHLIIGCDPHPNGSSNILREIERDNLKNILLYQGDCLDILSSPILNNFINCICIFFPDPWHKKRHQKRRLIKQAFLNLLWPSLKENGVIYIATDWEDYAQHINEVSLANKKYRLDYVPESHFPYTRTSTKYEQRGLNMGHCIQEFFLTKKL